MSFFIRVGFWACVRVWTCLRLLARLFASTVKTFPCQLWLIRPTTTTSFYIEIVLHVNWCCDLWLWPIQSAMSNYQHSSPQNEQMSYYCFPNWTQFQIVIFVNHISTKPLLLFQLCRVLMRRAQGWTDGVWRTRSVGFFVQRTTRCVSVLHISHFELLVGPVASLSMFLFSDDCSVSSIGATTSLCSSAACVVSASLLDNVERAVTDSVVLLECEESASESLSLVSRSIVLLALDAELYGVFVPSSLNSEPSVAAGLPLSVNIDILGLDVERLSVAPSSPEPVNICAGTTVIVVKGDCTTAAGPVVVAV